MLLIIGFACAILVSAQFIELAAAKDYSVAFERFKDARVVAVQRIWRPIKPTALVWKLMNYAHIEHAGLLLFLEHKGNGPQNQQQQTLVVHTIPKYFTVVEETSELKFKDWEAFEGIVNVVGQRAVKEFVEAGGKAYDALKNMCVDSARRMMHVADPKEEFVLGLKKAEEQWQDPQAKLHFDTIMAL